MELLHTWKHYTRYIVHSYKGLEFNISMVVLFAFDLYDNDSSGIIDADEVDKMLKEIYGKNFAKNIHAQR